MNKPETIPEIFERVRGLQILDEDDIEQVFELEPAASESEIETFASGVMPRGRNLPDELAELWRTANGGYVWGLEFLSTHTNETIDGNAIPGSNDELWLGFHSWGNGDFDHVVTQPSRIYSPGSVVFYSHESGRHAVVRNSLREWIRDATNEIASRGTMLHPFDYLHAPESTGMYRSVFEAIRD